MCALVCVCLCVCLCLCVRLISLSLARRFMAAIRAALGSSDKAARERLSSKRPAGGRAFMRVNSCVCECVSQGWSAAAAAVARSVAGNYGNDARCAISFAVPRTVLARDSVRRMS